jgi:hypothetical protein
LYTFGAQIHLSPHPTKVITAIATRNELATTLCRALLRACVAELLLQVRKAAAV